MNSSHFEIQADLEKSLSDYQKYERLISGEFIDDRTAEASERALNALELLYPALKSARAEIGE